MSRRCDGSWKSKRRLRTTRMRALIDVLEPEMTLQLKLRKPVLSSLLTGIEFVITGLDTERTDAGPMGNECYSGGCYLGGRLCPRKG